MIALISLTGSACWTDLRRRLIPNALTVAYASAGFLYQGVAHGWSGLTQALLGGAAAMAPLLIMYVLRGIGGGDVKWFFAFGVWAGAQLALQLVVHSILAAGVIALGLLLFRRLKRQEAGRGEIIGKIHSENLDEGQAERTTDAVAGVAVSAAAAGIARTASTTKGAMKATFPFMAAVAPAFVYVFYGQW